MNFMRRLLEITAWPMTVPAVYGKFHMVVTIVGIAAAILLAWTVSRCAKKNWRIDGFVGLFLLVTEVYKQLFRFYIMDGRHYNVEFVPFQLCSIPMYLCLILWILERQIEKNPESEKTLSMQRIVKILNTFLMDFNLMGALLVFADPSGIFWQYAAMTWHGIIWHLLIVFIGVYKGITGQGMHESIKGFLKTLPLFFGCCGIATILNVCLHEYGYISMFYITPYWPSIQIVFSDIAARWGIFAGNVVYIFAMILGGFLCHLLWWRIGRYRKNAGVD